MAESNIPNKNNTDFSPLDFPKINWRSDFWLAIIPFVLGLIPLVFPDISGLPVYKTYRLPIAVLLLLSPLIIPITLWGSRCLLVVFARSKSHPLIFNELTKTISELQEVKQNIYELVAKISNQKVFDVSSAVYQEKLYITIPKGRSRLNQGDMVVVVHTEDGMTMGFFEIIQIRNLDYLAEAKSGVDAVWLGYVIQQGKLSVLPYFSAVYIPQGDQSD